MPKSFMEMDIFTSDSDYESYTETSDSEDHDDSESSYSGHAQSILSNLDECIGKINDFLYYDRVFLLGDVVCSVKDPSANLGRIVDVNMTVDLEESNGQVLKDVDSKKLLKVKSFASGDYVVSGSWLGRVNTVVDIITILFADGTKCDMTAGEVEMLRPLSPGMYQDAPFPCYPGQKVRIKNPSVSNTTRWFCGSWKGHPEEGTICHVEVGWVHVSWITSILINSGTTPATPACLQDPRGLTLLSCLPHTNWQVGDWCNLPDEYSHNLLNGTHGLVCQHFAPNSVGKMQKKIGLFDSFKKMFVITKAKRKVDVLWQDGTKSVGLDPQNLLPTNNVGDHDFWTDQYVCEKVTEDANVGTSQRVGIVKDVDSQERTVKVKWVDPAVKGVGGGEDCVEVVSFYELVEHPDWSYCIGDIIFRMLHQGKFPLNDQDNCQWDNIGFNHKNTDDFLSCFGNVVGFIDGDIEVKWASGLISKVKPSEIIGLDSFDNPASQSVTNEDSFHENFSREIIELNKQSSQKKEKVLKDHTELQKKETWDSSTLSYTRTAIGFLTNVANKLFASNGSPSPSGSLEGLSDLQPLKDGVLLDDVETSTGNISAPTNEVNMKEEMNLSASSNEILGKFKKFDIVDDYSDHHFIDFVGKGLSLCQMPKGWLRKIQQEWSILNKDLPDGIYVRVYEERIDLLRASITGAEGTPYHDGLFFFDILFPPGYPHEPPMVHYKSGGLRLNPNLYESGKVCLSLLMTWTGAGTEVWNTESSTVLQVLLSLQALVLNSKPYFNEAGYDKQIGSIKGEKNSVTYNENAFILSCKTMLYHLHKPPKHFEDLIKEHFAQRAHDLLRACKSYMDGAEVGFAHEYANAAEGKRNSSTGFRLILGKLMPKLVSSFTEKGIDCGQFMDEGNSATAMC